LRNLLLLLLVTFTSCVNPSNQKKLASLTDSKKTKLPDKNFSQQKQTVLILPPFDEMANAGISPDIQKYLEDEFAKDSSIILIKFPLRKLMKVPYQMIFDKMFCKPIIDKIKTDIIIMSKLDQVTPVGTLFNNKWIVRFRIYNTNSENQINSSIYADSLTSDELKKFIESNRDQLIREIRNNQ
jgi:hypothetical protein